MKEQINSILNERTSVLVKHTLEITPTSSSKAEFDSDFYTIAEAKSSREQTVMLEQASDYGSPMLKKKLVEIRLKSVVDQEDLINRKTYDPPRCFTEAVEPNRRKSERPV